MNAGEHAAGARNVLTYVEQGAEVRNMYSKVSFQYGCNVFSCVPVTIIADQAYVCVWWVLCPIFGGGGGLCCV